MKPKLKQKHIPGLFLGVGFIIVLIVAAYLTTITQKSETPETIQQQSTPSSVLRPSSAQYIGNFMATASENKLELRFSLMDGSKKYVSGDGNGYIRIVNSEGNQMYAGTITVKKEDFKTYTLVLTGATFLAYGWEIPFSEIKKSIYSSGTVYLKFENGDNNFEEIATSIGGLPTYTQGELTQLNEQEFSKSAIVANNSVSQGSFEVTVLRVGFFTPLVTWGEKKEYFRVDMSVKNIGSKPEYFSPSGLAILDGQGNQYDTEYGGTLGTFSQIYPGVETSGYLLFKTIPKNSQSIKFVFQLGHDERYTPYNFEYNTSLNK